MNYLEPATIEMMVAERKKMTPEQRRGDFATNIDKARDHIMCVAACVRAMQEEGDNLTEIKELYGSRLIERLLLVANNQLDACAFHRWQFDRPGLLNVVRLLPLADQKHLGRGGKIEVVTAAGEVRMMAPDEDGFPTSQVFDGSHIRTVPEQKTFQERSRRSEAAAKVERVGRIGIDYERALFKISRIGDYTPAEFEAALRELRR